MGMYSVGGIVPTCETLSFVIYVSGDIFDTFDM